MFFIGCAWLAGLGDTPLPESSGDGGGESSPPDEDGAGESTFYDSRDASDDIDSSTNARTDSATDHGLASTEDVAIDVAGDSSTDRVADVTGEPPADVTGELPADVTGESPFDSRADSPDDSAVESAAPLNPGMLSGIVLWLDATNGLSYSDGGASTLTWRDQSGQHNDATSFGAPSIHLGAIGGRPAAHFNGVTDYFLVQDSASLEFSTLDFLVAVVVAHKTPPDAGVGYGTLYSKQVTDVSPYPGFNLSANAADSLMPSASIWAQVTFQSGSFVESAGANLNDGRPMCVTVHRFEVAPGVATLGLRINGADAASGTGAGYATDVSSMGYPLYVGGTNNQQDVFGDIAEVIAVKGAVPDSDLRGLEAYLMAKYQL